MDKKSIIDKVKELLFSEEEVVAAFEDVKTSDGLVLRVTEIAEGASVSIISEDGENVSGAAEYTLENGTIIAVDESGVITSITEAAVEEEVVEEEEMQEEVVEEVNPLEERIGKLEKGIEDILAKFSEMNTKVEEFASAPASDEVKIGKKEFKKVDKYSALDELSRFRKNKK